MKVVYHCICVRGVIAMLFEAGIILGAHSEPVSYPVLSGSSHIRWPYLQLERTVNVFEIFAGGCVQTVLLVILNIRLIYIRHLCLKTSSYKFLS